MDKSFPKILILTLGITVLIYSISKTDFSFKIRKLDENAMCENEAVPKEFLNKYLKENVNYTYNPKNDEYTKINVEEIKKLRELKSTKDILSTLVPILSIGNPLLLFSLILVSFTFGGFCYYCSCFYGRCCLCDNKIKEKKCPYIFFILSIFLYVIIIISSLSGNKQNIKEGFFTTLCSISKFVTNVFEGDDNINANPRWIGIKKFTDNLNNLTKTLRVSVENKDDLINENSKIENEVDNLTEAFNELPKEINLFTNPNPKNNTMVISSVLLNDIANISFELASKLSPSILGIKALTFLVQNLSEIYEQIEQSLKDITSSINTFSNDFNQQMKNLSENEVIVYLMKDTLISRVQDSIFSFIIIISLIIIISSFLSIKFYSMKFVAFTGWSCLHCILMFILFFGIIFSILGFVSQSVFALIHDQLNNNGTLFFNVTDVKNFIDVCYNGNGDLSYFSNQLKKEINNTKFVDDIYKKYDEFKQYNESIYNMKSFDSIEFSKNEMNTNYIIMNSNELIDSLNEFNKYINYGQNNYILQESVIKPYEIFVVSSNKCLNDYKYTKYEEVIIDSSENNKLCFVISEWNSNSFESRYKDKNIKISSLEYNDFNTLINEYKNSLFSFITEVDNYMKKNSYKNKIESIDSHSKNLLNHIKSGLSYSYNVINPIFNFFEPITHGKGILSSLNCKFLHKDFNLFFEAFDHDFSLTMRNLGSYFNIIGICICLSTYFLLIALSKIPQSQDDLRFKEGNLIGGFVDKSLEMKTNSYSG